MTLELIKGAALLLSLSLLQSFNVRLWGKREHLQRLASGLIFGGISVVGMMLPIEISPGVIFDARSAIVSMAGLFGGPVTGGVAALVAGSYRWHLGGAGAPIGVIVVGCSLAWGLLAYYGRERGRFTVDLPRLLALGLAAHVVNVGLFTQLPNAVMARVMETLALPYVLTFAPATAFLGLLLRDIERRQATDAALRDRDREQSSILNNSPAVIFLKDVDGRFLFVNRQFEALLGIAAEDLIGRTDHDVLPPGIADQVRANDLWVHRHDAPLETEEVVQVGGESRTYIVNKFPLRDAGGQIYAVCGIATDITDRIRADAERLQAMEAAEQANRAKSGFLAAISHDFRTPLNAIMGFSEMLRQPPVGGLRPEKVTEYATHIHESGAHMLDLINEILDISAIEAGKRTFVRVPLDLEALARSCVDNLKPAADAGGVSLRLELPDTLPPLTADRRSLTQIFYNLLSNAIKFTPAGGTATISVTHANGDLTLRVADTGIGIPADDLATVTEPFSRSQANPHLAQPGTGLGLSIVKSLVEAHGGRLDIESEVGVGTTVTVALRLDQDGA